MKSERRHELQKNELADRLASGIESTRSFLPAILGGLVIVAIGAIGWGLYSGYNKSQASAAWTEFYFNLTGGDADSFVDLADEHPGSAAAGWARQFAGDNYLQRGIGMMYSNRAQAKELLGKAIGVFEEVEQGAGNPELRSKALLGLAQAHESLGETDKAASFYQQLAKIATQPGLIREANQRLA
ncbi:MAG: tetratricopeptide repeat protein, partial [Planctomycetales bacterium]|nr:tetratricopeptide repeat protein [Planctomycetales bacterium]